MLQRSSRHTQQQQQQQQHEKKAKKQQTIYQLKENNRKPRTLQRETALTKLDSTRLSSFLCQRSFIIKPTESSVHGTRCACLGDLWHIQDFSETGRYWHLLIIKALSGSLEAAEWGLSVVRKLTSRKSRYNNIFCVGKAVGHYGCIHRENNNSKAVVTEITRY